MLGAKIKILVPILLLVVGVTQAQDTAPWPPDPADFFAPGVEVVSTQESYFPRVIADDENRIIKVFDIDTGDWQEFPYPDEAALLSRRIKERSNGTIAFNEPSNDLYANQPDWPETWLLNPDTGVFSRAEIVCDWHIRDLPGDGEWIFFGQDGSTHLCFTETGQLSLPLPSDIVWIVDSVLGSPPVLSPDGRWLVLMAYKDNEVTSYGSFIIYSYELDADKLNYLGEFYRDMFQEYQYFSGWVSDTKGMIQQSGPEIYGSDVYAFDVTEPDSLTLVLEGRWSQFFDDPPREEYLETTRFLEFKFGTSVGEHVPCTFSVYDEYGFDTFELGYDCGGIQRSGDDYLYLGFRRDLPPGISTLNHLNRMTGQHGEIFNGEIEALDSISPDGRYVVLLMDRSGHIETQDVYPEDFAWYELDNAYIAIIDTIDTRAGGYADIVYQSESFENLYQYNAFEKAEWIDNRTLLLALQCFDDWCVRLITLSESGYTVNAFERVDDPLMLSPDQNIFLTTVSDESGAVLAAIKVSDGSMFAIGEKSILKANQYKWLDNNLLAITIPHEANENNRGKFITYTIRIPQ